MGIYEDLGVRTIINVAGSSTRVGGALMPDEVVRAMSEAANASVKIVGLLTALRIFSSGAYAHETERQRGFMEYIADGVSGLPVKPRIILPEGEGYPILHLALDCSAVNRTGFELSRMLKNGDPGVFVNEGLLHQNTLVIHPINLDRQKSETLVNQLRNALNDG